MELKRLSEDMEKMFDDFMAQWEGEEVDPSCLMRYDGDFPAFCRRLGQSEESGCGQGVPFTLLFLTDGEKIYGSLEIRHRLSGRLAEYGGHIGYGVAPPYRGNGYGALMVKKAMPYIQSLGIESAVICSLKSNPASIATIKKLGGKLKEEKDIVFPDGTKTIQCFEPETKL